MTKFSCEWLERTLLGDLLLVAGLLKMADAGHFQAMLSRYGLFPAATLPYVAPIIIMGEILLALALLSGRRSADCLKVCEALFYLFSLAVGSVLYRGLQIRCACFGVFSVRVSPMHLVVCLAIAVYLTWRRSSGRQDGGLQGLVRVR